MAVVVVFSFFFKTSSLGAFVLLFVALPSSFCGGGGEAVAVVDVVVELALVVAISF